MTLKKLCLIWAGVIFALLILSGGLHKPGDSETISERDAKAARLYLESAKAASEFNGRDLTSFEEQELWQFSKVEAASGSK